jgi:hypothetical protein
VGVWKRLAFKVGGEFVRHIVPAVMKPALSLWNQIIGFIFLCFGVTMGGFAIRYATAGDPARVVLASIGALMMLGYGISSFIRAHKISRS